MGNEASMFGPKFSKMPVGRNPAMPDMMPGQGAMMPQMPQGGMPGSPMPPGARIPQQGTGLLEQMQPQPAPPMPPMPWDDFIDMGIRVHDDGTEKTMSVDIKPIHPQDTDEVVQLLFFLLSSRDPARVLWSTVPERVRRHFKEHTE